MKKFTPGPWVSEIHRINTPNEQSVGFFVRTITDKPGERRQISGYVKTYNPELFKEIEANAALIAAAPEMYEALKNLKECIEDYFGKNEREFLKCGDKDVDGFFTQQYIAACNALKKAMGEE